MEKELYNSERLNNLPTVTQLMRAILATWDDLFDLNTHVTSWIFPLVLAFQQGMILPSGGHLAMPQDIFGSHTWGGMLLVCDG